MMNDNWYDEDWDTEFQGWDSDLQEEETKAWDECDRMFKVTGRVFVPVQGTCGWILESIQIF